MMSDKLGADKNRIVTTIIIQARMSSERFPGKMMSFLAGVPLIEYVYRRCAQSDYANVLIATSDDISDDILYGYCVKNNIPVMRGDLQNVLRRYIQAAELIKAKYIIRVCGDTPFVDISLINNFCGRLIKEKLDYISADRNTCMAGFYSEGVTVGALEKVAEVTNAKENVEHVTKFIVDNPDIFTAKFVDAGLNPRFVRKIRLTIDYPDDIKRANSIIKGLPDKLCFTSQDVLNAIFNKESI